MGPQAGLYTRYGLKRTLVPAGWFRLCHEGILPWLRLATTCKGAAPRHNVLSDDLTMVPQHWRRQAIAGDLVAGRPVPVDYMPFRR